MARKHGSRKVGKPPVPPVGTKPTDPGTSDPAGQKAPSGKRTVHPSVGNEDVKVYPFTETPGDFDFDTHVALKKKDFAADHMYYTFQAEKLDFKATMFREKAEEARKMGSAKERSKAKRLRKMQTKMAELRAQLEAQGLDVDELLAAQDEKE